MYKLTTKLTAFIVCSVFITSCQKDSGGDLPATTDKVKTYTEDVTSSYTGHTVTTYNLSYDGSNRITALLDAADPGNKITYAYNSDNTIASDIYSAGALLIHEEFYMVNNRLDSTFQYHTAGDTTTEKYLYNSAGDWTKSYEYDYSKVTGSDLFNTITYTYDGNGNQLKAEGTDTNVETYEYYADQVYIHPLIGPSLIPVVKHNLIKTQTITSNGSHVGTLTYTYTFDSNNRMSTEKAVADNGSVIIKTYTYY